MPLSEFEIIQHYFERQGLTRPEVLTGIGDDAAVLRPPADRELVIAIDTLVAGVHFPENTPAEDIGWKVLAVNLSDLAAMGAEPAWFTLALTMPTASQHWLEAFSRGLFELAQQHRIALVGGDTTHGALTISVQIAGYLPPGKAILRKGASAGDLVYLTGTIGDAAVALSLLLGELKAEVPQKAELLRRLNRPQPRVAEGQAIRELAHCAIDISDGLWADIEHMLAASGVGARIELSRLPLSAGVERLLTSRPSLWRTILGGGDDYELCFCISPENRNSLEQLAQQQGFRFTCIGSITAEPGLTCVDTGGQPLSMAVSGYQHFKKDEE